MKKILLIFWGIILTILLSAYNETENEPKKNPELIIENMKLKVTIGDVVLTATFADNPTAKDFILLLPLTVKLDDYASSEKIFYSERKLSTKNAGSINAVAGDITYYSPWGNVAIFYKDFGISSSLIRIAKLDGNIDALKTAGSIENVRFELLEEE